MFDQIEQTKLEIEAALPSVDKALSAFHPLATLKQADYLDQQTKLQKKQMEL